MAYPRLEELVDSPRRCLGEGRDGPNKLVEGSSASALRVVSR